MNKLKPKEELFCYHFAKLQNCKEAAIKAGFSTFCAESKGDELLQAPQITRKIQKIMHKQEFDELQNGVVASLKRLAFGSTNDCVKLLVLDKETFIQSVDNLDLFHISEIKVPKDGSLEIKFFDRFKAYDKLLEIIEANSNKNSSNSFLSALEKSSDNNSFIEDCVGDEYGV